MRRRLRVVRRRQRVLGRLRVVVHVAVGVVHRQLCSEVLTGFARGTVRFFGARKKVGGFVMGAAGDQKK